MRLSAWFGRSLTLLTLSAALGACTSATEEENDAEDGNASAYTGGKTDYAHSGVGFLVIRGESEKILASCTATLIAPKVVVTSAECAQRSPAGLRESCTNALDCCAGKGLSCLATALRTRCDSLASACKVDTTETIDVFFGVDPTKPAAGERWIRVAGLQAKAGPLVALSLETAAPVAPLPVNLDRLSPSARWVTARLPGYGPTGFLNRSDRPGTRNELALTVREVNESTITVLPGLTKGQREADRGGPILLPIDGVDTVVGIEWQSSTVLPVSGVLLFERTDKYRALFESARAQ